MCGVQYLIGIGIADATEHARIRKGPLERSIFGGKCGTKRVEITGENIDSARVYRTQSLFAPEDMQRCAALCTRFSEYERAIGEIEGRQVLPAREFCLRRAPM